MKGRWGVLDHFLSCCRSVCDRCRRSHYAALLSVWETPSTLRPEWNQTENVSCEHLSIISVVVVVVVIIINFLCGNQTMTLQHVPKGNLITFTAALKIHVSQDGTDILTKLGGYTLEPRGLVKLKVRTSMRYFSLMNLCLDWTPASCAQGVTCLLQGKGELYTFWLVSEDKSVRMRRLNRMPPPLYSDAMLQSGGSMRKQPQQPQQPQQQQQQQQPSRTFLELIRDSDSSSSLRNKSGGQSVLRRVPSSCLRRVPSSGLRRVPSNSSATGRKRRSLDGPVRELPNGCVNGSTNCDSVDPDKGADEVVSIPVDCDIPHIVVDKQQGNGESPSAPFWTTWNWPPIG